MIVNNPKLQNDLPPWKGTDYFENIHMELKIY